MDMEFKNRFIETWNEFFPGCGLPVVWYYTDNVKEEELKESRTVFRCMIGNLKSVLKGQTYIYEALTPGCLGGKRYSGYSQKLKKNFEYFLSYGIEGEMEGERYKKTPELVTEQLKHQPPFTAPGKYLIFKRWDKLEENEEPAAVLFIARPDILSGLFTLANYDSSDQDAVFAPFGSGCASIISYPLQEMEKENPRCILGMFDVSARPHVPADTLSFTIPYKRFVQMAANMQESFFITNSWKEVTERF